MTTALDGIATRLKNRLDRLGHALKAAKGSNALWLEGPLDDDQLAAAVAEHRRRTGAVGTIWVVGTRRELSHLEWEARYRPAVERTGGSERTDSAPDRSTGRE